MQQYYFITDLNLKKTKTQNVIMKEEFTQKN